MQRLTREEALKMILEIEKSDLLQTPREELISRILNIQEGFLVTYSGAMLSNKLLALTGGEYGVDY